MKNIHPLTTAGLGLGAAAVALLFSGYVPVASALALVALFFTMPEVPKFTSVYQFVLLPIHGLILGYSLDFGQDRFPFFAVLVFIIAISPLFRLIFYKQMLHSRLIWFEPTLLSCATAGIVVVNLLYPGHWQSWFYPSLPILFNAHLFSTFVADGRKIKSLERQSKETKVGSPAPDFELPDQHGQPVKLSDLKGKRPVLLIFLRGDWCPACHMMLRTYEKSREKLRDRNVLLLAIGPDDLGVNLQMAQKLGVEFRILADTKQQAAIAYGTHWDKNPISTPLRSEYAAGQPMPSTFLICDRGLIRYQSRPEQAGEFLNPEMVFKVLEEIGK